MIFLGKMSLIVVSFMVEFGDDGGEVRKVVQPKHDDPGFVVLAMADDRDFLYTGIGHRLVERFVKPESFAPFALDMDVRDIRNDIRAVGRALKLLPAPGCDPQNAGQFGGKLPFAPLSLTL